MGMGQSQWPNIWMMTMMDEDAPFLKQNQLCFPFPRPSTSISCAKSHFLSPVISCIPSKQPPNWN